MKELPPFRLDSANQCLRRRGNVDDHERVLLTPKAFAVLRYLVQHAGRLVTQDELLEAVWPDTYVQPEVLKYPIADVRSALGDRARNPVHIATLPRRGYRFMPRLREAESESLAEPTRGELVGRDDPLNELRGGLQRMLRGERHVVFITGELGIGKTALADEFRRRTAAEVPSIRIAREQCVEGYGGKVAYYPVLEALGDLCRAPDGDSAVQILAVQAPTWLAQSPSLVKRAHRETPQREIQGARLADNAT